MQGLINAHLLSQGRFFFPLSVNQIRFCLYVIPVSDLDHVAEQEKAPS